AGVVDQYIEPAELLVDGREQPGDLRLVRHVGSHRDGLRAGTLQLLEQLLRSIRAVMEVQAQRVTLGRCEPGGSGANPAAGACDQHDSGHGKTPTNGLEMSRTVLI